MRDAAETIDEERVELGEIAHSLGFLLRLAQLKAFDSFYKTLLDFDFKLGEYTVLWVIGLNPGLRQGTIARKLNIKPAHMTKLVQRMVAAGYIAREIPADDRRSVHLALTDEGAALVAKNRDAFLNQHLTERDGLSEKEATQLIVLLNKYTGVGGGEKE